MEIPLDTAPSGQKILQYTSPYFLPVCKYAGFIGIIIGDNT